MVIEEVTETWVEQCKMGKTRKKADLAHKHRFISRMFLQGDSVELIIRLRLEMEGNGADHNTTGPEDISRMTLGSATIGQLAGWQGETHTSRHDSTLHPDPTNIIIFN